MATNLTYDQGVWYLDLDIEHHQTNVVEATRHGDGSDFRLYTLLPPLVGEGPEDEVYEWDITNTDHNVNVGPTVNENLLSLTRLVEAEYRYSIGFEAIGTAGLGRRVMTIRNDDWELVCVCYGEGAGENFRWRIRTAQRSTSARTGQRPKTRKTIQRPASSRPVQRAT